ncbi:hypothetical protein FOA52_005705 [Chlamydomonas sp. UWO 241]|nr:hypothetical protein FOA52_005705 [Chlamydomonas sp. UWO 241]
MRTRGGGAQEAACSDGPSAPVHERQETTAVSTAQEPEGRSSRGVLSQGWECTGRKRAGCSSRYLGVSWCTETSAWIVQLWDPQTKRQRRIGCYASEEDAARAYDCAAVQAHGPGAKRIFLGEAISKLPETVGEQKKQRSSSRYIGVSWSKTKSSWHVRLRDPASKRERHIGLFASEEDAAKAYDCAAVQAHGQGAKRKFPGEATREVPASLGEERKRPSSSRYIGVCWHKAQSSWRVRLTDPQTKSSRQIGCFASYTYDRAAVQACGSGAERNFPGEAISKVPVTVGEQLKQHSSSRFIGVSWQKTKYAWRVDLNDPHTKRQRHIGCFASEEDAARAHDCAAVQAHGPDPNTKRLRHIGSFASKKEAARAYDCAAVQAHGPGAKRNFPGEAISELPETVGEKKKKKRSSSRFIGVSWHKSRSAWRVGLTDPNTKRLRHIGSFASKEEAARAYDCAAVQVHGPGAKRNFPGEAISELPETVGELWKERSSSRYEGVWWNKATSSWGVKLWDPQTKRRQHIGLFASEEDAARAYDCAAVQAHGPGAKRNFPGEAISIEWVAAGT